MVKITNKIKKLIEENPLAFATVDNKGKWKKFAEGISENKGLPVKGAILVMILKLVRLA